jgi:hypothetical protein
MASRNIDEFLKLYKAFRDYCEHENDLINHRTTWLITVQSVLAATFVFSTQKYLETGQKLHEMAIDASIKGVDARTEALNKLIEQINNRYFLFGIIISVLGFISSIGAWFGINAARKAQKAVYALWDKRHKDDTFASHLPYICGGGDETAERWGSWFAEYLPLFFAALWIVAILVVMLGVKLTTSVL